MWKRLLSTLCALLWVIPELDAAAFSELRTKYKGKDTTITYGVSLPKGDQKVDVKKIVFVCPYPAQTAQEGLSFGLAQGLNQAGFTVISVAFPNGQPPYPFKDRTKWYYYTESESDEVLWQIYQRFMKEKGLVEDRIYLTGQSGGGTQAMYFAAKYPERVYAVAAVGSSAIIEPIKNTLSDPCLWFLGWNWNDEVSYHNIVSYSRLKNSDYYCLPAEFIPEWYRRGPARALFEHCPDENSIKAAVEFIKGVAEKKSQSKVDPEKWESTVLPIQLLIEYDEEERKQALESKKVFFLPSKKMAEHMEARPAELQVIRYGEGLRQRAIWTAPRDSANLKGIIWHVSDSKHLSDTDRKYDLLYLAANGWVAIDIRGDLEDSIDFKINKVFALLPEQFNNLKQVGLVIGRPPAAGLVEATEKWEQYIYLSDPEGEMTENFTFWEAFAGKKIKMPTYFVAISKKTKILMENHPLFKDGSIDMQNAPWQVVLAGEGDLMLQVYQKSLEQVQRKFAELLK